MLTKSQVGRVILQAKDGITLKLIDGRMVLKSKVGIVIRKSIDGRMIHNANGVYISKNS
jgi:hypothetical protein